MRPKFVYLTATVENLGDTELSDVYFQNHPELLQQEGNSLVHLDSLEEGVDFTVYSGEVDYFDNHGEGDSFYRMPTLKKKEQRLIHFGFFMEEEQLDKMILPVFNYSNPEDLSDKDAKWIDIRQ